MKPHRKHFNESKIEREIPKDIILSLLQFNPTEWKVVTAEVRNDTSKFFNATWERMIGSDKYWITTGIRGYGSNHYKKRVCRIGYNIIKEGPLYNYVSEVNQELMKQS